jgi:hypothetical protein
VHACNFNLCLKEFLQIKSKEYELKSQKSAKHTSKQGTMIFKSQQLAEHVDTACHPSLQKAEAGGW